MRRREFIAALGSAATWPLVARAQQKTMPMIGFLSPGSPGPGGPLLAAFRQGLSETGHTEGQNITIEYHWVEQHDRLSALAADLVDRKVDLIIALTDAVCVLFLAGVRRSWRAHKLRAEPCGHAPSHGGVRSQDFAGRKTRRSSS